MKHFQALRGDNPHLQGLVVTGDGEGDAPSHEENELRTVWWPRDGIERHLARVDNLAAHASSHYLNLPAISRIWKGTMADEIADLTRGVHREGARFLGEPTDSERTPAEFVQGFIRRLAERVGGDMPPAPGDLCELARRMDPGDIPAEVRRVLDHLDDAAGLGIFRPGGFHAHP